MTASLTVAICTKDREQTLLDCATHAAASLKNANIHSTAQLLIIDDGALSEVYKNDLQATADRHHITLSYVKKAHFHQPGLYGSRRLAVQIADSSHILFIDDDCMLDETYIRTAMDVVSSNPALAGLSGVDRRNLVNPTAAQKLFWRLFLLSSGDSGKLSYTGFNYGHSLWLGKTAIFESDFVHGCNMLFLVSALERLPDCSWLEGHSVCEDLVLASTAVKHGAILISPHLKFEHLETPGGRGNALKRLTRKYRSHFNFSRMKNGSGLGDVLFLWSVTGGLLYIASKMLASKLGARAHLKN